MKLSKELSIFSEISTISIKNYSSEMMLQFMPALNQLIDIAETYQSSSAIPSSIIDDATVVEESLSVIKLSDSRTDIKPEKRTFTIKECPMEIILEKPLDESSMVNLLRLVGEHSTNSLSSQNAQILTDMLERFQLVDKIKHQRTGVRIICRIPEQTFRPLYRLPQVVDHFTGREIELAGLSAHRGNLQIITEADVSGADVEDEEKAVSQIAGTGGVGKSQLANYFARLHFKQKYYNWVIWITGGNDEASTRNNVLSQLVDLGKALGLDTKELSEKVLHQLIYERLAAKGRGLLVIDDIPNYSVIKAYLPESFNQRNCEVLITTRNSRTFGPTINKIILDVFTLQDAKNYISKVLKNISDLQAELLANTLGRYPLALTQALAYIINTGTEIELYCQRYNDLVKAKKIYLGASVFEADPYTTDQCRRDMNLKASMLTVIEMSLQRLRELCKTDTEFQQTQQVLKGASYLSPQVAIPKALLCGWILTPENFQFQDLLINSALEKLRALSLVEDSEHRDTYQIHQVVQDILRIDETKAVTEERSIKWCAIFRAYFGITDINSLNGEKILSELFPHAEWLRQVISKLELNKDLTWAASQFLQIMGIASQKRGNDKAARMYFADELQILLHSDNQEKSIAACRMHIGITMLVSDPHEARMLLEQALPVLIRAYGEMNENVALCLMHLGSALNGCGKKREGLSCLQKSWQIYRMISPKDHSSLDSCQTNYASALLHENPQEAKLHLGQVLPKIRKAYGEAHPRTADCLMHFGAAHSACGEYAQGIVLLKQALEILCKNRGDHHMDVGHCREFLGNSLAGSGDFYNARIQLEQAFEIIKDSLGAQSEELSVIRVNLGNVLLECGIQGGDANTRLNLARSAKMHFELALPAILKTKGGRHVTVGLCKLSLGKAMITCNEDPNRVMEHVTGALAILREAHGNSHPDVGKCLMFKGMLESSAGSLFIERGPKDVCAKYLLEAKSNVEEAVLIFTRAYGEMHPETLRCSALLEDVRQELLQAGIADQMTARPARDFQQRTMPIEESILDYIDPQRMPISFDQGLNIAQYLFSISQLKTAMRILEKLIAIDPENADVYVLKSNCHTIMLQFDLAETCMAMALSLDPDLDTFFLTSLEETRGTYNASLALSQELGSRKDLTPEEKIKLAISLRTIGKPREALEILNNLMPQSEPRLLGPIYYHCAVCHVMNDDLMSAHRCIQESLNINRHGKAISFESLIVKSLQAEKQINRLLPVIEFLPPEVTQNVRPN